GGFSVTRYGLVHAAGSLKYRPSRVTGFFQQPQDRIPATDFTAVRSLVLTSWASNRGAALSLAAVFASADFQTSQGVVPRWYMSVSSWCSLKVSMHQKWSEG